MNLVRGECDGNLNKVQENDGYDKVELVATSCGLIVLVKLFHLLIPCHSLSQPLMYNVCL